MLHILNKKDVKQFHLDNTHKEQKWDERKPPPPKNTEFHEVHENFPKGRNTTGWTSHTQCEYKKYPCLLKISYYHFKHASHKAWMGTCKGDSSLFH